MFRQKVIALGAALAVVGIPSTINAIRTYQRNGAARHVLAQIRQAIDEAQDQQTAAEPTHDDAPFDGYPCPKCRQGRLRPVRHIAPRTWTADTSSG